MISLKNNFYEKLIKISSYFRGFLKLYYKKNCHKNDWMFKMTFYRKLFKPIFHWSFFKNSYLKHSNKKWYTIKIILKITKTNQPRVIVNKIKITSKSSFLKKKWSESFDSSHYNFMQFLFFLLYRFTKFQTILVLSSNHAKCPTW
jgi:hypothetical protein